SEVSEGEILPEEICRKVVQFLSAQDATSFTSVNRFLRGSGQAKSVWEFIYRRDVDKDYSLGSSMPSFSDCATAKQAVAVNETKNSLPSLKWYPVLPPTGISGREGHLACTMTCGEERLIVLTGGFSDDSRIYMINPGKAFSSQPWNMTTVMPSPVASFVYGASLTPLPGRVDEVSGANVFRAVRFGGFRAGGYSNETDEVVLLEITQPTNTAEAASAKWTTIEAHESDRSSPRAYHTATLLMDRPRHGHSVILDSKRDRLVVFGGGSGSDLLRSGRDNAEVWEICMGKNWRESIDHRHSWPWRKIHGGVDEASASEGDSDQEEEDSNAADGNQDVSETTNTLSPAERLCLGRCHMSYKVGPDMVLLFFGSGRPSTNGVIAYDLSTDKFHRPTVYETCCPRFTGASAFLEEGYILCHGGYSTQLNDSIGQMDVIDLVPSLRNSFDKLPIDPHRPYHAAITDTQAESAGGNRGHHMGLMHMFLANLAYAQRRGGAAGGSEDEDDSDDEDYEMEAED
ncbi:MAG: hypothetical protein SGILL_008383, partial [Bacillariaceae sp.]